MGGEIDLLAETVLVMRWYRLVYAIILPAVYQIIMSVFVCVCAPWLFITRTRGDREMEVFAAVRD